MRIFPTSIANDLGRKLAEKNIAGILQFATEVDCVVEDASFLTSGINSFDYVPNSISSSTVSLYGGQAIMNGYQVELPGGATNQVQIDLSGVSSSSSAYIFLQLKFSDDTEQFVTYEASGSGGTDAQFFCVLDVEDPDDPSVLYDTTTEPGYIIRRMPLYSLQKEADSWIDPVDIRSYTRYNLPTVGMGSDSQTLLLSREQYNSLQNMLRDYVKYVHSDIQGYSELSDTFAANTESGDWGYNDGVTLPIAGSIGDNDEPSTDCLYRRVRNASAFANNEASSFDFINNRIILPDGSGVLSDNGSTITKTAVVQGSIPSVNSNGVIPSALLPSASTSVRGSVQISEQHYDGNAQTPGYVSGAILTFENNKLVSLGALNAFASIAVSAASGSTGSASGDAVAATNNNAQLNLVAGSNITLTNDVNAGSVEISQSGTVEKAYGLEYSAEHIDGRFTVDQNLRTDSTPLFSAVSVGTQETSGTLSLVDGVITTDSSTTITGDLTVTGNINATGSITGNVLYNAGYTDYAEWFLKDNPDEEFEEGDVIVKVREKLTYTRSNEDTSSIVVGVCSKHYGHILGGENLENMQDNSKKYIPVAIAGRIPVKVFGPVLEGSTLVAGSDLNHLGSAVVEHPIISSVRPKRVVGVALESSSDEGVKLIWTLIK